MSELKNLPNVGKVLEEHLLAVGIETHQQLKETGAQKTFLLIRMQRDPEACLHMLYGLQEAILSFKRRNKNHLETIIQDAFQRLSFAPYQRCSLKDSLSKSPSESDTTTEAKNPPTRIPFTLQIQIQLLAFFPF